MPTVTLSRVKEALSGYKGTADDAALTVELAVAESQVASFCGWPVADDGTRSFLSGTYTLYPDRSRARPRLLPLFFAPSAVASVHVSSALVDSGDYSITDRGLWRLEGGDWSSAYRGNKVVATIGWASDAAPESVQAAVVAQCVHRWRVLRHGQGYAQATQQGTSVSRDALTGLPAVVQDMARLCPAYCVEDSLG